MTATAFDSLAVRDEHLRAMHEFLTARGGWELADYSAAAEDGYPDDLEPSWRYRLSYDSQEFRHIDDVGPKDLTCHIYFGNDAVYFEISEAGNSNGCGDHDTLKHRFVIDPDNDELPLDAIDPVLLTAEVSSRCIDARVLIECRFFGSCGESFQPN